MLISCRNLYIQNDVWSDIWALHGPVKLTRKINYQRSILRHLGIHMYFLKSYSSPNDEDNKIIIYITWYNYLEYNWKSLTPSQEEGVIFYSQLKYCNIKFKILKYYDIESIHLILHDKEKKGENKNICYTHTHTHTHECIHNKIRK